MCVLARLTLGLYKTVYVAGKTLDFDFRKLPAAEHWAECEHWAE